MGHCYLRLSAMQCIVIAQIVGGRCAKGGKRLPGSSSLSPDPATYQQSDPKWNGSEMQERNLLLYQSAKYFLVIFLSSKEPVGLFIDADLSSRMLFWSKLSKTGFGAGGGVAVCTQNSHSTTIRGYKVSNSWTSLIKATKQWEVTKVYSWDQRGSLGTVNSVINTDPELRFNTRLSAGPKRAWAQTGRGGWGVAEREEQPRPDGAQA